MTGLTNAGPDDHRNGAPPQQSLDFSDCRPDPFLSLLEFDIKASCTFRGKSHTKIIEISNATHCRKIRILWHHPQALAAHRQGLACPDYRNGILIKYAGIMVNVGESGQERDEYIQTSRESRQVGGHGGALATSVLKGAISSYRRVRDTIKRGAR